MAKQNGVTAVPDNAEHTTPMESGALNNISGPSHDNSEPPEATSTVEQPSASSEEVHESAYPPMELGDDSVTDVTQESHHIEQPPEAEHGGVDHQSVPELAEHAEHPTPMETDALEDNVSGLSHNDDVPPPPVEVAATLEQPPEFFAPHAQSEVHEPVYPPLELGQELSETADVSHHTEQQPGAIETVTGHQDAFLSQDQNDEHSQVPITEPSEQNIPTMDHNLPGNVEHTHSTASGALDNIADQTYDNVEPPPDVPTAETVEQPLEFFAPPAATEAHKPAFAPTGDACSTTPDAPHHAEQQPAAAESVTDPNVPSKEQEEEQSQAAEITEPFEASIPAADNAEAFQQVEQTEVSEPSELLITDDTPEVASLPSFVPPAPTEETAPAGDDLSEKPAQESEQVPPSEPIQSQDEVPTVVGETQGSSEEHPLLSEEAQ